MKIEVNPSRMTIEELNDAIAELVAQRDRVMEEKRQAIEESCYLSFTNMMLDVHNFTGDTYNAWVTVKSRTGREHRICLSDMIHYDFHVVAKVTEQ